MVTSSFRLPFDIFGIPIRPDATFVLLVALLTWKTGLPNRRAACRAVGFRRAGTGPGPDRAPG